MSDYSDYGIILKGVGGLYSVYYRDRVMMCGARGILKRSNGKLLIGDIVSLCECDFDEGRGTIDSVQPRRNVLVRPAVANVDKIILIVAAVSPTPDLYLVDTLMVNARASGIEPVLVINKTDQGRETADAIAAQYRYAARCHVVSASNQQGTEPVIRELDGCTCVLAGQSGVGKSTLLNAVMSSDMMETGIISDKTLRGKHTTRHTELFRVDNELLTKPSFLIDSPGFSLLEKDNILPKDLPFTYPEVYNNEGECRFRDCSHTGECGCFVTELVERGLFPKERYTRYCAIYKELAEREKNKYK